MPCESSGPICYRSGYKYQLLRDWKVRTPIVGVRAAIDGFVELQEDGWLLFRAGYAWDGPSGPTLDTSDSMRASLAHDGLYQFLREGKLPQANRLIADGLLRTICLEDGMSRARADLWYQAVRAFAGPAAKVRQSEIWAPHAPP